MQYISVCKGVSGSGKSTRVFLFFKFLKEVCKFDVEDFKFINFEGKEKIVGILVIDLDLVFIGKLYETSGFERFQGYDVMTGYFGKSSYFSDFLRDNHDKHSFIVEGAGVTGTNRLRPFFLKEFCGFDNIMVQYYNYDLNQHEEYQNRIVYRSGKVPSKGTMWDKCSGFISDHRDSKIEIEQLIAKYPDINAHTFYNYYDVNVYDFGVKMLAFLGLDSLCLKFINYCNQSDYTKLNSYKTFSNE